MILAVSHNEFLKIPLNIWEDQFNGKGIIIDIKSAYDKNFLLIQKLNIGVIK